MNKRTSRSNVIILIAVIAVYALVCLTKHQHDRLTADTMLYFSIAQKYLAGDIHHAINGYWGPLLAWLLVPFLYLGVPDVVAINVLNTIIGILTITGVWILADRLELTGRIKGLVVVAVLPVVYKFSLVQPMDFLLVCILVYYLAVVFNRAYPVRAGSGALSGMLGTLAYLTKAYAFPFFIVHFIIMNVLHCFGTGGEKYRIKILKHAVLGLVLFSLFSGAWIMTISDKYGHFTFSTMRETNFNAPGPDVEGEGLEFGVPVFHEGFFPPPNDTAFVIWEDPSYLRGKPWSALQSTTHLKHFIKLVLKNISEGLKIYGIFSPLSIGIILAYILFLSARPVREWPSGGAMVYPLFTLVLFTGGYLLFHLEERYLWLVNILLLLMGGYTLSVLFGKDFFASPSRKNILLIFFVLSFIFTPLKFIAQVSRGGMDKYAYLVSTDLKKYNIRGNIASNREYVPVHDAWHKTFRLAYWLESRYYGQPREGIGGEELKEELEKYDISYYFVWGAEPPVPPFLNQYEEITGNEIPGLKIYSLKNTVGMFDAGSGRE